MASKMTTDRVRREMSLRGTLEYCHAETIRGMCERFAPLLESDEDLEGALDLLLRVLERGLGERQRGLDRADSRHQDQWQLLAGLRRRRDKAAREVRKALVEIRASLSGFCGRKAGGTWLGLQGNTAKAHDAFPLHEQGRLALKRLRDPDLEPPKPRQEGLSIPFDQWRRTWIESLEPAHTRLGRALDEIRHEIRRRESTHLDKSQQMALHDRDLSAISNLQEALLVLGMRYTLARTVWSSQRPEGRPPRRKGGGKKEQDEGHTET